MKTKVTKTLSLNRTEDAHFNSRMSDRKLSLTLNWINEHLTSFVGSKKIKMNDSLSERVYEFTFNDPAEASWFALSYSDKTVRVPNEN